MLYNYKQTFSFLNIGYGSAISYTLTLILGVIALIYIKFLKREQNDEER